MPDFCMGTSVHTRLPCGVSGPFFPGGPRPAEPEKRPVERVRFPYAVKMRRPKE